MSDKTYNFKWQRVVDLTIDDGQMSASRWSSTEGLSGTTTSMKRFTSTSPSSRCGGC